MNHEQRPKAIIYCRVSHSKQRTEGQGLTSQEHRCRQYAATEGYEVEAVFPDNVSGGGDCGKPLTACWSKGRNKHHPHYYCVTKGCESRSKSRAAANRSGGM